MKSVFNKEKYFLLIIAFSFFFSLKVFPYASGVLDTSFGGGDGFFTHDVFQENDFGKDIVYSNGFMYIAGSAFKSSGYDMALWKISAAGVLEYVKTQHGSAGGNRNDQAEGIAVDQNGKIIVVGASDKGPDDKNVALVVWRFLENGDLDRTFGSKGYVTTTNSAGGKWDFGFDVAVQSDGKIVVSGSSKGSDGRVRMAVWRFKDDGKLDRNFGDKGIFISTGTGYELGNNIGLQTDGKIIVSGISASDVYLSQADIKAWRLNTDGTLDDTFAANGVFTLQSGGWDHYTCEGMQIQEDDKIVLAGDFGYQNYEYYDAVAVRLDIDGNLDNNFASNGIFRLNISRLDTFTSVAKQSDGSLVFAGYSMYGTADIDIMSVRLSSDGHRDMNYGASGVFTHDNAAGGADYDHSFQLLIPDDEHIWIVGESYNAQDNYDLAVWGLK